MKKIPSVVQLPGGIKLQAIPFRITEYDADGRPKTFEICDQSATPGQDGVWALFGDERAVRAVIKPPKRD